MGHPVREGLVFALVLGACVAAFFHESLLGGKVLSPADVLLVSASFRDEGEADYEPANRLLMDPVLQFQPWLEFNRRMIRDGRLPLWNPDAGCGAPHLANGQSAVFDPFHLLAYLGKTPESYAWIAAGRLFAAGLGMFLLARSWGLGFWGRWFAGLVYPFCGFLVVWLLFPVTSVAIWMPWLFLAVDRVFRVPGLAIGRHSWRSRRLLVILGGHIQTSAHVLLAGGLYAAWRWIGRRVGEFDRRRVLVAWTAGTVLGIGLAAVQILPLAALPVPEPGLGRATDARARRGGRSSGLASSMPPARRCLMPTGASGGGIPTWPGAGRAQPERVGGGLCRAGDPDLAGAPGLPGRAGGRRAWPSWSAMAAFGAMGAFRDPAGRKPAAGLSRPRCDRQPAAHALAGLRPDPARRDRRRPPRPDVSPGTRLDRAAGSWARRCSGRRPGRSRGWSRRSVRGPSPIIAEPRSGARPTRSTTACGRIVRSERRSSFCRGTTAWRRRSSSSSLRWHCRRRQLRRRAGSDLPCSAGRHADRAGPVWLRAQSGDRTSRPRA